MAETARPSTVDSGLAPADTAAEHDQLTRLRADYDRAVSGPPAVITSAGKFTGPVGTAYAAVMDGGGLQPSGPPGSAAGGAAPGFTATGTWVGVAAQVELTVTDADTAQALGSGDVPVLATPRVLALVEAATVAATAALLPTGATTVGSRIELEHRVATPVGRTVVAQARLVQADGRRLTFEVELRDGAVTVAEGRIERILVDRHRFVEKAFDPR